MHVRRVLASAIVGVLFTAGCLGGSTDDRNEATKVAKGGAQSGRTPSLPGGLSFVATLPDGSLADPNLLTGIPPLLGEQRFTGKSAGEPTIGIDAKGNLFMSHIDFAGPGDLPRSFVYGSKDQGATWQDVSPKVPNNAATNPPVTLDPFVHVDPLTGRLFSSDLQAVACNWLMWSDDQGTTWTTNPTGCGQPMGVHDHQSIYTGKPRATPTAGYPNMVYYCVNRIGDTSCAASNNGGIAFGPLVPIMLGVDQEAGRVCGGLAAHVKTDNAGRVFIGKVQCGVPSVGVSEDDGKTWKVYVINRAVGARGNDHEVAIAVDDADNVYAFWIASNGLPVVSVSTNHGAAWSTPRVVSPPGVTATSLPAIDGAAAGKIAFSYLGTTHPKGYQNRNASDWAGATWNAYLGVMTDVFAENSLVLTVTANPLDDPVSINNCGSGRCTGPDGLGPYDFIDLDIDANGRPWAVNVDNCFEKCRADQLKDPKSAQRENSIGFVATLATGPALTVEGLPLPPLPLVPVPT